MISHRLLRRRTLFSLALVLAAGAAVSNAAAEVVVETRTDKEQYLAGAETVLIDVVVTNTGPDPVTLEFDRSCRVAFEVIDHSGHQVYETSESACPGFPGSIVLEPAQSQTFPLSWTQATFSGPAPSPASYWIRGILLASTSLYSNRTYGSPVSIRLVHMCDDGADNDGDGRTDYADDTGCSAPGDTSEELNDDDLSLELVPTIKGYVTGEVARFDLKITNLARETYRRAFPSSCIGFFTVDNPDVYLETLYDLREHVECLAVVTELVLEPGASEAIAFFWRFVNDAGQPVPSPRAYTVRASFGFPEPVRTVTGYVGLDLACSDRLDNDGDGLVDYPSDPGCYDDIDRDELDFFRELKVEVRVDRASYPPGDDVFIDVLVTNVSEQAVTLNFSCLYDQHQVRFVVETLDGQVIYRPPLPPCLTITDRLVLLPGQTETVYHYWPQQDFVGVPVPSPSQWVIRSEVDSLEPVPVDTKRISVGIGCSDGFDNDLDGLTDYPEDPGCASETDNDESGSLTVSIDSLGLSWTPAPEALSYDVARLLIYPFGGPYSIERCEADNTVETTLPITGTPFPRYVWAYVVRTIHAGGGGSYDSDSPLQVGSRDPVINSSFGYCP
jgi:hypothetical protein